MQVKRDEFRPYVYGDDIRHISWTTSARTNDTVLKTFEEERDKNYFLVVDVSASARKGPIGGSVAFRIAEIAATLALSAEDLGEKMGLVKKTGMTYEYCPIDKKAENLKLGRGYDATRQFLKENTAIREEILAKIRTKLAEEK
jgi:uncharacterized protein (DUF58 family)